MFFDLGDLEEITLAKHLKRNLWLNLPVKATFLTAGRIRDITGLDVSGECHINPFARQASKTTVPFRNRCFPQMPNRKRFLSHRLTSIGSRKTGGMLFLQPVHSLHGVESGAEGVPSSFHEVRISLIL